MSRDLVQKFAAELEAAAQGKAYRAAIRDVRREVNLLLDNMLREGPQPEGNTKAPKEPASLREVVSDAIENAHSGHALVLDLIEKIPGLRGSEIIAQLEANRTPVHERTVRTALFRLKKGSTIEQRDGRWYVTRQYENLMRK